MPRLHPRHSPRGRAWRSLCVPVVLLLAGCGGGIHTDYDALELKEISGTITLDGEAVAGAAVLFEADDKSFSYATTDTSGYYQLQFNSEQSGVLGGPKIVRIGTTLRTGDAADEGSDDESAESEGAANGSTGERIPACYNSESVLRVTVSSSTTMNFDLKSDCSTTGPSE